MKSNSWDRAAPVRDMQLTTGNDITFEYIFKPFYIDLVKKQRPNKLLEVGCGTGHLAECLIDLVDSLCALDPSPEMHKIASNRLPRGEIFNCSIEEFECGKCFDLIISHMCVQAIEDICNFLKKISMLLLPEGFFVFSTVHPCFWNNYKEYIPQVIYNYMTPLSTTATLTITRDNSNPIIGIPYHHRPLQAYFDAIFNSNLVVKKFLEIYPSEQIQSLYGVKWAEPRYCIFITEKEQQR